jgi:hypothetical protein
MDGTAYRPFVKELGVTVNPETTEESANVLVRMEKVFMMDEYDMIEEMNRVVRSLSKIFMSSSVK